MYRVDGFKTGQGFKAHDRQLRSMRSAWAGGLHLRRCTIGVVGKGRERDFKHKAYIRGAARTR
ncbi:MAG TPA: hypothetical protein VNU73_09040, partial [Steroidobacteraceae bacterium]|nr:hypothetical protein [Steroidobacteraceae bacterium]